MMILASLPEFTPSVSQKINTIWLLWSLRQAVIALLWERGMVKFASLPKFASSVLQIVLTSRFVRSQGELGARSVSLSGTPPTILDIQWMVILARVSVLAASCSKKITAFKLPGSLRERGCGLYVVAGGGVVVGVLELVVIVAKLEQQHGKTHLSGLDQQQSACCVQLPVRRGSMCSKSWC